MQGTLDTIAIVAVFLCSFQVPFTLGSFFPYWSSPVGRSYVAMDSCLAISLFPAVLHHLFGLNDEAGFLGYFHIITLTLIGVVILWRETVIYKIQREVRRRGPEVPEPAEPGERLL
jgi:hypothetical protein